ncbi:hypothetical protein [Burkholderia glumae]|uniref:hypothetical protein n=1 Tax=Burkholderia glumae TaxID=337 RepID=UPI001E6156F5|nr:hypothetical protein [Burkholderia glumae]
MIDSLVWVESVIAWPALPVNARQSLRWSLETTVVNRRRIADCTPRDAKPVVHAIQYRRQGSGAIE